MTFVLHIHIHTPNMKIHAYACTHAHTCTQAHTRTLFEFGISEHKLLIELFTQADERGTRTSIYVQFFPHACCLPAVSGALKSMSQSPLRHPRFAISVALEVFTLPASSGQGRQPACLQGPGIAGPAPSLPPCRGGPVHYSAC